MNLVCCISLLTAGIVTTSLPAVQWDLSPERFRRHLSVLAHDSLQGRGTGTSGEEKAARYLQNELRAYGIPPAPGTTDYLQTFPLHGSTALQETELTLYAPKDSYRLRLQEDYVLYSSGAQTSIASPVRMVFVGYGIVAPEYDYNDYRNIDVRNAIVVFLSGEPVSRDRNFFDGERETHHSSFVLKQKNALARGAKGSILIPNPNDRTMDDWYEQQRHFLFEEVRLLMSPSENLNILLNPKLSPFLFTDAPFSLEQIEVMDRRGSMRSFELSLRGSFQGKFAERDFFSSNVAGYIRGTDPELRSTTLLISAHYDHLGIGPAVENDSIYNGLFDNAAGVAAVLEIAHALSRPEAAPRRSVLFLFLTGEERGFLGSRHYVLNPLLPLHTTVANINVDGLSMFEKIRSVIGIGGDLSDLGEWLTESLAPAGITVDSIPAGLFRADEFRNSDQYIFAQAGIPSILIAEGLRYEHSTDDEGIRRYLRWSEEIYHTPLDDLQQSFDITASLQHIGLLLRFSTFVARHPATPQWKQRTPYNNARLRSAAEQK